MGTTPLSNTVHTQTFGNDTKPTIYYVTGYGSTIAHFSLHMLLLTLFGYRVVAFDHDKELLDRGDPSKLKEACDVILKYIQDDRKIHTTAGLYGISLGTFIVLYVATQTDIRRIALSAGADSFTRIVQEQPRLRTIKQEFKNNGYDETGLASAWAEYDIATHGDLFTDKKLLVMVSQADDLIKYIAVIKNVTLYKAAGAEVTLTVTKRLGHGQVIIRNCLRIIRTARFFRK